jgi:hypothetical protein
MVTVQGSLQCPPSCILFYILHPKTQDIKPSNKLHTYDAKDISELLNSHDQEFMFDHPIKIWRQGTTAVEEAETHKPKHEERTKTVLNSTGGLYSVKLASRCLGQYSNK